MENTIVIKGIFGGIEIEIDDKTPKFVVKASGYIGPSLIKRDLEEAAKFGEEHPNGWFYIVDTTSVKLVNPFNIFYLKNIPNLPNIKKYIVIAPLAMVRLLIKIGSPFVKPDYICHSIDKAIIYCKEICG